MMGKTLFTLCRQREQEILLAEQRRQEQQAELLLARAFIKQPQERDFFPPLKDVHHVYQKNEGRWCYSLQEDDEFCALVLKLDIGRHIETSLIQVDVQPGFVRLLIKGRLFQLVLPEAVQPDDYTVVRGRGSKALIVTMPKQHVRHTETETVGLAMCPNAGGKQAIQQQRNLGKVCSKHKELLGAVITKVVIEEVDGMDGLPEL
jgi:hypothetical protein